jgi:hypothetical protein
MSNCLSLRTSWQRAVSRLNELKDRLRSMVPEDPSYALVERQIAEQTQVVAEAQDAYQACEESNPSS